MTPYQSVTCHSERAQTKERVRAARHVLVKGDGAEWMRQGAEQVFPGHVFQLDCWHLLDRIAGSNVVGCAGAAGGPIAC